MSIKKFCDPKLNVTNITQLLQLLPYESIIEDAWDAFNEYQKGSHPSTRFVCCRIDDLSNFYGDIIAVSEQLSNIIEYQRDLQNDAFFFWNALASVNKSTNGDYSCNHDISTTGDTFSNLIPEQALLLILINFIYGDNTKAFLECSRLFLLLCQFPDSKEHFFSPNIFIVRQILYPLRATLLSDALCPSFSHQDLLPHADEQDSGKSSIDTCSLLLIEKDLESLLTILNNFLHSTTVSFLGCENSREIVTLILEHLITALLEGHHSDTIRNNVHNSIIRFIMRVDEQRHYTIFGDNVDYSSLTLEEKKQNLKKHSLFVMVEDEEFSVDILVYLLGYVLRPISVALACRPIIGSVPISCSTLPKRLLTSRQIATTFLEALIKNIPYVLDLDNFYLEFNKQDNESNVNLSVCRDPKRDSHIGDEVELDREKMVKRTDVSVKDNQKQLLAMSTCDPICACLARCCILVADRRETRELLASSIVHLLHIQFKNKKHTNHEEKKQSYINRMEAFLLRFIDFILQLMSSGKLSSFRTTALDVLKALLERFCQKIWPVSCDETMNENYQNSISLENYSKETILNLFHSILLAITKRISDIQPATRTRALECLSSVFSLLIQNEKFILNIQELLENTRAPGDGDTLKTSCLLIFCLPFHKWIGESLGPAINFSALIYDTVKDSRQIVRKASISLLTILALYFFKVSRSRAVSPHDLETLLEGYSVLNIQVTNILCTDSSVQVRQKVILAIHEILRAAPYTMKRLYSLWLSCVLPTIRDPEKTLVEKSLDIITGTIIQGVSQTPSNVLESQELFHRFVVDSSKESTENFNTSLCAWRLLQCATTEHLDYLGRFFNLVFVKENSMISNEFFLKLQLLVKTVFSSEMLNNYKLRSDQFDTWPLFSVLHMVKDIVNLQLLHQKKICNNVDISSSILLASAFNLGNFVLTHAKTAISLEYGLTTNEKKNYEFTFAGQYLLEALYCKFLLNCFKVEDCHHFVDVWQNVLMTFRAPLPLINASIKCLLAIDNNFSSQPNSNVLTKTLQMTKCFEDTCETLLENVFKVTPLENAFSQWTEKEEQTVTRCLSALGDFVLLSRYRPKASFVKMLQKLFLHKSPKISEKTCATDPLREKFCTRKITCFECVKAQVVIFLGKLCLCEKKQAKMIIDVLATGFTDDESEVVLCNLLAVFSDFCVRYAFLTDTYLLRFTSYLGSGLPASTNKTTASKSKVFPPIVRKQCLCLLAGLVAQDFVKCKGILVFRLLSCIGDSNPAIKCYSECVIKHILMPRQANFIQNHLVEMICFLCSWTDHPILKSAICYGYSTIRRGSRFCFIGQPKRRKSVYTFMLDQMNDKDRHELSRRLVHNFLGAFVDTVEDDVSRPPRRQLELPKSVEEPSGAALRDALRLLGCKQMKITFFRNRPHLTKSSQENEKEFADILPETDNVAACGETNSSQKNMTDAYEENLLKRNLAYQILPTLLSLKRVMEDARSPFLGDIIQCFKALLYDYRNELSEILFHDPILAKQLDFDFKRDQDQNLHSDLNLAPDNHNNDDTLIPCNTGGRRSLLLDVTGYDHTSGLYLRSRGDTINNCVLEGSGIRGARLMSGYESVTRWNHDNFIAPQPIVKRHDSVQKRMVSEIGSKNLENQLKDTPELLSNHVTSHANQKITSECYENNVQINENLNKQRVKTAIETSFETPTDLRERNGENLYSYSTDLEKSCSNQVDEQLTLLTEKKVSEDEYKQNKNGEKEHKTRHRKRKT